MDKCALSPQQIHGYILVWNLAKLTRISLHNSDIQFWNWRIRTKSFNGIGAKGLFSLRLHGGYLPSISTNSLEKPLNWSYWQTTKAQVYINTGFSSPSFQNTCYLYHTQKVTIHQVTIMLATSKNVLFPGHNHLLTTGADNPTLWLSPEHHSLKLHRRYLSSISTITWRNFAQRCLQISLHQYVESPQTYATPALVASSLTSPTNTPNSLYQHRLLLPLLSKYMLLVPHKESHYPPGNHHASHF